MKEIENTKMDKEEINNDNKDNIKTEEGLKEKNVIVGGETYSTGASAVANVLNSLVDEIKKKAETEKSKPKYKFLESKKNDKDYINKLQEVYDILEDIQKILDKYEYSVKIYEDLDC